MSVTAVGRGCVLVLVLVVVHDGGVVEVGLVGGLVLVVVHDVVGLISSVWKVRLIRNPKKGKLLRTSE